MTHPDGTPHDRDTILPAVQAEGIFSPVQANVLAPIGSIATNPTEQITIGDSDPARAAFIREAGAHKRNRAAYLRDRASDLSTFQEQFAQADDNKTRTELVVALRASDDQYTIANRAKGMATSRFSGEQIDDARRYARRGEPNPYIANCLDKAATLVGEAEHRETWAAILYDNPVTQTHIDSHPLLEIAEPGIVTVDDIIEMENRRYERVAAATQWGRKDPTAFRLGRTERDGKTPVRLQLFTAFEKLWNLEEQTTRDWEVEPSGIGKQAYEEFCDLLIRDGTISIDELAKRYEEAMGAVTAYYTRTATDTEQIFDDIRTGKASRDNNE